MQYLKEFSIFDDIAKSDEQEDIKKTKDLILKYQNRIKQLQNEGDDSYIKADIAECRRKIRELKDKLLTPKQRAQKDVQKRKAADRQHKKAMSKMQIFNKINRRFNKELSERDKAINKIASLQSTLRDMRTYRGESDAKTEMKYRNQIEELKTQYNIKSHEIRVKKLKQLDTDILLTIDTLDKAKEHYKACYKLVNSRSKKVQAELTPKKRNELFNQMSDLKKYYGDEAFYN